MAQLQLVVDHGKRHEVIRVADLLADYVDIIEIGYPELITFGLDIVKEIRDPVRGRKGVPRRHGRHAALL